MIRVSTFLITLIMAVLPLLCDVKSRTDVEVDFRIQEQKYRTFYNTSKNPVHSLEKKVRDQIIQVLNERIKFLNFTGSSSQYQLIIVLDVKDQLPSTSHLREVGFRLKLKCPSKSHIAPMYWIYRQANDYNAPLDKEEVFLDEIATIFQLKLEDPDSLTNNLFSNIIIANEAFHYPQTKNLILPLSNGDCGIGRHSKFKIITEFNEIGMIIFIDLITVVIGHTAGNNTTIPLRYRHGKIVTEAIEPTDKIPHIEKNFKISAKEVYLVKYCPRIKRNANLETSPEKLTVKK